MTDQVSSTERIEAVQGDVVEQFTQLCGNPDDRAVAAAADRALTMLDDLLASVGTAS